MKGFDYLCWICQPFSQGRWRIKYLRKLHCSRLITCLACSESSDIASVLPCHRRHKVTGGHSVFFLYCLSFHDTMFVLQAVLITSGDHLPLASHSLAAQPVPSCLPHFTPPMHLFKASHFLSSVLRVKVLTAPFLHSLCLTCLIFFSLSTSYTLLFFHPSIVLILSCVCFPGLDVVNSWRAVLLCNHVCYFCRISIERIEKIRNLCKCNPLKTSELRVVHM